MLGYHISQYFFTSQQFLTMSYGDSRYGDRSSFRGSDRGGGGYGGGGGGRGGGGGGQLHLADD